jgi:hypothetical protein
MTKPESTRDNSTPITFISHGVKIKGWFFQATGSSPFPTVILLHGFPADKGDLFGLGKQMSQRGINAFAFNYSGNWESEGVCTPKTSLQDVESAISFLKSDEMIKRFRIDTAKISIVGYSYGGGFALLGSLCDPGVRKVVSLAGGDLSLIPKMDEQSEEFRKFHEAYIDKCESDSKVVRGIGGRGVHEFLSKHRDEYSFVKHAKKLANKDILLIGGWQDQDATVEDHILPLYRALLRNGAKSVRIEVFDTDHSFENVKKELTNLIVSWIMEESPKTKGKYKIKGVMEKLDSLRKKNTKAS